MKKWIKLVQLLIAVALLAFLIVHYHVTIRSIDLATSDLLWLIPCLIISIVLVPILAGYRWQTMLHALDSTYDALKLIRINFQSIFWGVFLPSSDGFALIRAYLLMRRIDRRTAIGSVIMEKFFGVLCLFLIALAASFFIQELSWIWLLRIMLICAIASLIAMVALIRKQSATEREDRNLLQRIVTQIRKLAGLLATADRKFLGQGIVLIVFVQLLSILNIHFLFFLLGHPLPLIQHLCFVPVIQTISLIPLTTSGFGIREGAFVFFYQRLDILPADLIAISILNFLIMTGIPALIGGVLSIHSNLRKVDVLVGGIQ